MEDKRELSKAKVEFRIHLFTYIVVMSFLIILNLLKTPESLWFIWPLLGWGIGISVHAFTVYFASGEQSPKE